MAARPRIGLLGGSFDPVHLAHVALAHAARKHLDLQRVELLPAARPWQRSALAASAEHRLNMLRLACAKEPGISINPIEIERGGATYTIDTLEALPADADYFWILGSDQLDNFCTWHRWPDILLRSSLAVAQRPGSATSPPAALAAAVPPGRLLEIPFTPLDISATDIRAALAAGRAPSDQLAPEVLEYIGRHGLYGYQIKDGASTT